MQIDNRLRSLLFVPGDSREKLVKAQEVPADALVVDWEDAVAPRNKTEARKLTVEFTPPASRAVSDGYPPAESCFSAEFQEDCAVLSSMRRRRSHAEQVPICGRSSPDWKKC